MEEDGLQYIEFQNEECRLRYTIAKYKEHDKKRNRYMAHLERQNDRYRQRIESLEALTERQHEEIDELMDAYDGAKPLIADRSHRAYVYELLKRATEGSKLKRKCENIEEENKTLHNKNKRLKEHNQSLKEKVEALENVIKSLHNGKR